jgi:GNAT superfamily N-acetyltransferase
MLLPRGERAVGNDGRFKVVLVTENSRLLPQVIDVLKRGECGTDETAPDPLLDWAYCGRSGEAVCNPLPDAPDSHRLRWFGWMADYTAHFGVSRNGLYALVDNTSHRVVAAAVTGPPRTVAFSKSFEEMGINIRRAGMEMGQEILCNNLRMKSLGQWLGATAERCGHLLQGNYLYVSMFATAPEYQGQGCGSLLLQFLGDVADADGVPSYLETAGTRNVTFYSTKGGYEEVARSVLASFEHGGGAVAMCRSAKKLASRN